MIESLLIKQVDMVLPDGIKTGDILIQNGKITRIDWTITASAEVVLQNTGLTLLPGVIDPHVHFRDPGALHKETLETGSMAAAAGGVTSFFDMPNTNPATISIESLEKKKHLASQKSLVNYNFFMGATPENLEDLVKAQNIPGIKIFMGSSTGSLLVDKRPDLESIFKHSPHLIAVHAEDEAIITQNKQKHAHSTDVHDHIKIRTPEAALKATKLAVELSKLYQKRLHICHLTTQEEAEFLSLEKISGLISTEVSPQHLLLSAPEVYQKWGTFAQINPPIREERHRLALWNALQSGVIDFIATDHAPHTIEEKNQPFGVAHSGMPGVETSLLLMLDLVSKKKITLSQVVKWLCEGPARIYHIQNKGKLQVGCDGDMVLVDLNAKKTIRNEDQHTHVKWSVFDGISVQGVPLITIVNGQVVFREGDFFTSVKGKEIAISGTH